MKHFHLVVGFVLSVGWASGFSADRLKVVATTSQVADMVSNIGGGAVEVQGLMGPGVDPHLYKATARDVIEIRRADLVFYSGLHLEGRLTVTLEKLGKSGKPIVEVTSAIPRDALLEPERYKENYDPHVWFDPELWALAVDRVRDVLIEADVSSESIYRANADRYRAEIISLRAWALERIAKIPETRRVIITSHDAYSYFGNAFGMEVVGVQGISTATEAGMADIAQMVSLIRERQIPAIFVESSVSPATIQRISQDSAAVVGGELYSDALGDPGEMREGANGALYDVGTYVGMFRYNVDTIVAALE